MFSFFYHVNGEGTFNIILILLTIHINWAIIYLLKHGMHKTFNCRILFIQKTPGVEINEVF